MIKQKSNLEEIKEATEHYNTIEISAKEGTNLEELLDEIEENLPYKMKKCEYLIPYDRSDMNSFLHRNGRVFEEDYKDEGTFMIVEVDDESYNKTKGLHHKYNNVIVNKRLLKIKRF